MFTIKIVHARGGEHHTRGVEAHDYEIVDNQTQHAVIARMTNGDDLCVPVRGGHNPDENADVVFIENAHGKTTDVVRA